VVTPVPPKPFNPPTATLDVGTQLYRVFTAAEGRTVTTFKSGFGAPTRFAFFGTPVIPVLYAAATEEAAVAETLLHDIPVSGGVLPYDKYARTVMARLQVARPIRVGILHGLGLRQFKVTAADLTASGAETYPETVKWAQAAHDAEFDGLVWMSRLRNDADSGVPKHLGDRPSPKRICLGPIQQYQLAGVDSTFGRLFATGADQLWLIDLCAPLHVDVLLAP
jgi:RES domain